MAEGQAKGGSMNELIKTEAEALPAAIEAALIGGDLSKLTVSERVIYYNRLCDSLGLNPLTKPFSYIVLNGKLTLYACKDCTEQLRNIKGVSVTDLTSKLEGGLYIVTAKGADKSGRCDAATGVVDLAELTGEKKANALMKAETKAKRRLTLSLCGLGVLDESEIDSIEGAKRVDENHGLKPAKEPVKVAASVGEDVPFLSEQELNFEAEIEPLKTKAEIMAAWDKFKVANINNKEILKDALSIRRKKINALGGGK